MLDELDAATGIAERDEDPSLEEIFNYIEDHSDPERCFDCVRGCLVRT